MKLIYTALAFAFLLPACKALDDTPPVGDAAAMAEISGNWRHYSTTSYLDTPANNRRHLGTQLVAPNYVFLHLKADGSYRTNLRFFDTSGFTGNATIGNGILTMHTKETLTIETYKYRYHGHSLVIIHENDYYKVTAYDSMLREP